MYQPIYNEIHAILRMLCYLKSSELMQQLLMSELTMLKLKS